MTLLPGRFGSSIVVSLEITPIAQLENLKFEALSYTWGDKSNPLEIQVKTQNRNNGSSENSCLASLFVTNNLHGALGHLRFKHESRLLWIDAICVNQQDLKERGSQVQLMPDIYGSADSVVVWLGPDSDSSRDVMRYFNELGSQITRDPERNHWIVAASPNDIDPNSKAFRSRMLPDVKLWSSICEVLSRPWFERLWIWQEVILARNKIVLSCGSMVIDFDHLCSSIIWLIGHRPDLFPELPYLACVLANRASNSMPKRGIINRLYETQGCQYSDQRDRVYGILSLCHDIDRKGITPDYTISAKKVYQNTLSQVLEYTKSLNMLCLCDRRDAASTMPTWIDWSVSTEVERIGMGRADANTAALASFNDEGVLTVMGVQVATVNQFQLADQLPEDQVGTAEAVVGLIARVLRSKTSLCKRFSSYESEILDLEASEILLRETDESLCHVLTCGSLSESFLPFEKRFPKLEDSIQYLSACRAWALGSLQAPPELYHQFIWQARRMMQGRTLIISTGGHLGLVPKATEVGDVICVMLGCSTPLVLRQKNALQYELMGPCYLDGITNGEALLGPLPNNWRLVSKYFPQYSRNYWVFLDQDTGKTQITDPRLGSLPAGWSLGSHDEEDAWNCWVNDDTEEGPSRFDPRLEFDALKARGIELQNFQIV